MFDMSPEALSIAAQFWAKPEATPNPGPQSGFTGEVIQNIIQHATPQTPVQDQINTSAIEHILASLKETATQIELPSISDLDLTPFIDKTTLIATLGTSAFVLFQVCSVAFAALAMTNMFFLATGLSLATLLILVTALASH